MERKMVDAKLQGMKRPELQRLAKKAGIKANMKTDAIIEALQKYYSDSGELPSNSSRSDDSSGAQSTSDSAASSANEESVEKGSMSPKRVVRRGRKGRKTRVKHEAKPNNDVITPDKAAQQVQKPQTSTTESTDKQKTEVTCTKSTTSKTDSTAPSDTVTHEVPNRRETHSVTPKTEKKIIPIVAKAPVLRRTTRSVTPKGDSSKPAKKEAKNSARKVRKKRSSVLSDPKMKKAIMADLEKTAEEKVSLQSKIPKPKTAVAKATKPITPGNKDWNRIHQAQFDKMESIGDYMARKRKRTESIRASAKKLKLIADETQSQSAALSRTPQGGNAKIAKPVSRVRATITSFSSPKFTSKTPKPSMAQAPIPKTTGIKTVTFKTSRLKTPTRATLLLGGVSSKGGLIRRRKSTPGPRKSIAVIVTPGKKPVFDLTSNRQSMGLGGTSSTTPFKFGQTTPGPEAQKSAFDLKASLNKPLGYKPYTGKLKPLDTMSTFPSASNIQRAKVNIMKKPALKTRDTRRAGARQTRSVKRANDVMARRGIKAM